MYLLDTNIISRSDVFVKISEQHPDISNAEMFMSVVTLAEVRRGIGMLRRKGETAKASKIEGWWNQIEHLYGDRILDFDKAAAAAAADIAVEAAMAGHDPGWADIQIAATARTHGLTVLTRNARHFAHLGVPYLDPVGAP